MSSPAILWIFVVLDRFLQRHRRNDGGDPFGEHRFSRAGRPDHEDVVTAGDRDFDRAFHVALAFDVGEIDVVILVGREELAQVAARPVAIPFRP